MRINKPLWHEGILLLPQLFQQQENYMLALLKQQATFKLPFSWGIERLQVDDKTLKQGIFKLDDIAAHLPDGTFIDSAISGILPPSRTLVDSFDEQGEMQVWLVLPELNPYGNNLLTDSNSDQDVLRRYKRSYAKIADLMGEETDEIAVEQLNVTIRFASEEMDGCSVLPIARLQRNIQGEVILDQSFIPPTLLNSSSMILVSIVQQLVEILEAKQLRLLQQRRERNHLAADYMVSDIGLFWLLNTIGHAWPELRMFALKPQQSPYSLYLVLARLAGSLCTFSLEKTLSEIPPYDHLQLGLTFRQLDKMIRDLLDTVIPTPVVMLELKKQNATHWVTHLTDSRLRDGADYYLSARSSLPLHILQEQLPLVSKIGSPDDVAEILPSALNGIPLSFAQRLPSALPTRADNVYFSLDSHHPAFAKMVAVQSCSFYVPLFVTDLKLEFYAVPKS